ncbi:hypothetical protein H7J73_15515 [Mycolicibacterium komossense]|uniref:Cellulose synthase n=1 Tax=Mycolicibacterium komossense TaxID=1779 RepID=A0ABT3CDF7_9MYCO|nr:hypothetical protein [Mycolicibacterium komossense]
MVALCAATVAVGISSPQAWSAPGDGGLVADFPRLGLEQVGADSTLAFYGSQGVTSITLPVPPGLVPSELTAVAELPVNLGSGTLTVTQGNRTLSRVVLPNVDRLPITIPLDGVAVEDNAVTLTLRTYLSPIAGYCLDPTNPLRLTDAGIVYSGSENPPKAIADFLPPILQRINLFVSPTPTRAESDAAIRLATAVVAHYGKQNTAVTVSPLGQGETAPPQPSQPMERNVVIREDPDAGISLVGDVGVPALIISGPASELTNQSRLMSSGLSRLALSSKAVVGPLRSSPQLAADNTTMRQLGQPGVNATALSPQVSIALDQTRLGRPAHDIRIHLQGSYTPLPPTIGGQLIAAIGGEVIDRWPADSSGSINRWVNIPDRLLQRYTNLGVALNISGDTGRCGEFQPITLTIDGDSAIQSALSIPPVPGGFQALPQAFMPRVQVGIGDSFDDTRRAVSILVGLQRLSALPIETAVKSVPEAISSEGPAVLVAADGWTDSSITLPVATNTSGELTVQNVDGSGAEGKLTLDPGSPFGSLQTMFDGKRTLLIATSNNAPDQLDGLLIWLDSDVEHWSRLNGNALIEAPGRPPMQLSTDVAAAPEGPSQNRTALYLGIGAGVVALVVVGAGLIVLRSRRPQG